MPQFDKSHRVNHSADNMFALVADVEKYPDFVPLCQALTVRSERGRDGRRILVADMTAGYKMVRETFTCRVILDDTTRAIDVSYVDGPFEYLDNAWRFEALGENACDVKFSIDYEFKSRALAMLMGSMFDHAFAKFTQAFEERADEIYGNSTTA